MKRKKFEEEWTVIEKFADDTPEARASLDEGLRILARMRVEAFLLVNDDARYGL
jgi:hypothetical protein